MPMYLYMYLEKDDRCRLGVHPNPIASKPIPIWRQIFLNLYFIHIQTALYRFQT